MFKLEIETENAAFGEADCETFGEIHRILIELRRKVGHEAQADVSGNRTKLWAEPIRDVNGNKIGSFIYEGPEQ